MPPPSEVFAVRERERLKQREERAKERTLKVHEKMTYSTRRNSKLAGLRKQVLTPDPTSGDSALRKDSSRQDDTQFLLASTKDRCLEKEDLRNYVGRKKEMFLVQYSLGVKREEIQKLEEIAHAEEKKLEAAEKYLEQSATMFDDFLKENDKNAVEAIKMAEAATKAKLEKVAEIKKLNAHLIAMKNEISRNNDLLSELRTFKNFLDSLAPQEWRDQREEKAANAAKVKATPSLMDKGEEEEGEEGKEGGGGGGGGGRGRQSEELYFMDPAELISIFTELEEQNLSLIQNSQETEITLEEMKQNMHMVEQRMNKDIENLKKQIDLLQKGIAREEEKAYDLEIKSRLYSYGEYRAEDQDKMLEDLNKKVVEVYASCIGANEANIPTLQMLAAIENRLEELFENMEALPAEKIEAAEKAKEKERRIRQREEKLEEQRQAQEERLRRALERAQADPKKRVGRRLVFRSEPPVLQKKQEDRDEKKEREEEEMLYFFS